MAALVHFVKNQRNPGTHRDADGVDADQVTTTQGNARRHPYLTILCNRLRGLLRLYALTFARRQDSRASEIDNHIPAALSKQPVHGFGTREHRVVLLGQFDGAAGAFGTQV